MGQNISSTQKHKKYHSVVIGYTSITPTKMIESDNHNNDNVLFNPHHYDISKSDNNQLWEDLIYIDQTYYSNKIKQKETRQKKTLIPGDALTVNDALNPHVRHLYNLCLSRKAIKCLSPNIGMLTMIKRLNLSFNQLKEIPEEIGHLRNLECLQLSNNQLTFLPDSICHLSKLVELKLAHNCIEHLTPYISQLDRLEILDLEDNRLREFNLCLDNLLNLNVLDLSFNPISVLPAKVMQLQSLRRLCIDGCLFKSEHQSNLIHDPPSLLELCARSIIKNQTKVLYLMGHKKQTSISDTLRPKLTASLYQYLSNSKTCNFCHGPYFDSYVVRGGWMERNGQWIPLEYRLCSAHWSDEQDRIYAMFSTTHPKQCKTTLTYKPEIRSQPVTITQSPSWLSDTDTIANVECNTK